MKETGQPASDARAVSRLAPRSKLKEPQNISSLFQFHTKEWRHVAANSLTNESSMSTRAGFFVSLLANGPARLM